MKKAKGMKKHSLRVKMTVALIVMMCAAFIFCWILNRTMMEHYFIQTERKGITKMYEQIDKELSSHGSVSTLYLEQLATKNNRKIMIAQSEQDVMGMNLEMVYSSTGQTGKTYARMYRLLQSLQDSQILGNYSESKKDIEQNGYTISERSDSNLGSTSITLIGVLGDNYYIAIDSSVESLQTAAGIATRFLAYAAIIVIILASLSMFWYSRRFTKPIEEMSEIAKRMTKLDFDARVTNLPNDEIGQLGNSMNQLSGQLEATISELKSANVELQKDIADKVKIDEMRKEFLSHVSHELKTPIALIQGYAEGLVDNVNDDPDSRDFYCDVIIDEAKKMNTMVQKLMTLNQIEFGQNQVDMQRFNLTELIHNILESNQIRFQQKNVKMEYLQSAPVYGWGDEFMIEDVVNNYVSNSYNHVYEGGTVQIWMEVHDKTVRTWVYNEGKTIPEEELSKIWIKFYKVDKARTREYGGSGVGLSIVAATMEAHGGSYGAVNKEHGPAFYFDLELG
jgi:signal transduction histidine kinase